MVEQGPAVAGGDTAAAARRMVPAQRGLSKNDLRPVVGLGQDSATVAARDVARDLGPAVQCDASGLECIDGAATSPCGVAGESGGVDPQIGTRALDGAA